MDLLTQQFTLDYQDEDGRAIRGVVTRPARQTEPLPAVLVVHGFKGFLRWGFFPELQRRLARAGHIAVAINLSGSGVGEDLENFTDDDGFFHSTPSRDVEDLACVTSFLRANDLGIDLERLAVLGHSRGGGTALLYAAESEAFRAVVTWAAVSTTQRFPEELFDGWRELGVLQIPNARTGQTHRLSRAWLDDAEENAEALDIRAACAKLETPTLLVHGTKDMTVPFAEAEALANSFTHANAQLHAIEGTGHTFGAVHPNQGAPAELEEAFEVTLAFLDEELAG